MVHECLKACDDIGFAPQCLVIDACRANVETGKTAAIERKQAGVDQHNAAADTVPGHSDETCVTNGGADIAYPLFDEKRTIRHLRPIPLGSGRLSDDPAGVSHEASCDTEVVESFQILAGPEHTVKVVHCFGRGSRRQGMLMGSMPIATRDEAAHASEMRVERFLWTDRWSHLSIGLKIRKEWPRGKRVAAWLG